MQNTSYAIDKDAALIVDNILLHSGKGLISGQFDLFIPFFCLPYSIDAAEDTIEIRDREALRRTFDSMHRYYRQRRVNQLDRHCIAARFEDRTLAHTTHQTVMWSDGVLIHSPFVVFSVTELCSDGVWRSRFSSYAFSGNKDEYDAFISAAAANPSDRHLP